MILARATSKIPDNVFEIEQNVMYVGKHDYVIDGRYRFYLNGKAKLGESNITDGFYMGITKAVLIVPNGSAVCFDRFPYPKKKQIQPAPVAPVVQYDDPESRIRMILDRELSRVRQQGVFGDDEEKEDQLRQMLNDFLSDDSDDEVDLYVSGIGVLDDLSGVDNEEDLPLAEPNATQVSESESEQERGEEPSKESTEQSVSTA